MDYIGLDVHKAFCQASTQDLEGNEFSNERIDTNQAAINRFLDRFTKAKFVLESTNVWEFIYELIEARGFEVLLAHPLKVKAIASAKIKTDKIDAKTLCDLLRANLIPTSYVPKKEVRDMRELLRHRTTLVRKATAFKNRIHAELLRRGITRPPGMKTAFTAISKRWMRSLEILALDSNLVCLEAIEGEISKLNLRLREEFRKRPEAVLLATLKGIGYYTALTLVFEIDDINRFSSPEKLCSYVGIVPSVRQSGTKAYYGSITKQGTSHLRWLIIEAAHTHVRSCPNSDLTRFHERILKKKGKGKAIVATARKMLHIIYWMLKRGEKYHSHGFNPVTPPA